MSGTSKVFVGSIPHSINEEQLKAYVTPYGRVETLFYMQDQMEQQRGWALVTYTTRESAIQAIQGIDGKIAIEGFERPLEARFANQKSSSGGARQQQQQAQQSSWQQFFTPEGHPYYYNIQTGTTQWERPAGMDNPPPPPQRGGRNGSKSGRGGEGGGGGGGGFGPLGANLFVFHIPPDWTDLDLFQHFQHFGQIVSARVQKDNQGKNRGFGFVSFDTQNAAINAIRGMHGFSVGGKFLKVQLKKGEEMYLQPVLQQQLMATMAGGGGGPMMGNVLAGGVQGAGATMAMGFGAGGVGVTAATPGVSTAGQVIQMAAAQPGVQAPMTASPVRYTPY